MIRSIESLFNLTKWSKSCIKAHHVQEAFYNTTWILNHVFSEDRNSSTNDIILDIVGKLMCTFFKIIEPFSFFF